MICYYFINLPVRIPSLPFMTEREMLVNVQYQFLSKMMLIGITYPDHIDDQTGLLYSLLEVTLCEEDLHLLDLTGYYMVKIIKQLYDQFNISAILAGYDKYQIIDVYLMFQKGEDYVTLVIAVK